MAAPNVLAARRVPAGDAYREYERIGLSSRARGPPLI